MFTENQQKDYIATTEHFLKTAPEKLASEIEELRDTIRYHDWRYYVLADPVVSDFEYDTLFKKLQAIEKQKPELITEDSPTQRVAQALTKDFPTAEHIIPMLSLDNSYNEQDLLDWDKRVKSFVSGEVAYSVEPKFDGGSFSLVYENDKFVRGATRGNGVAGEEVTNNLKVIGALPLRPKFSKYKIQKVEIRGEVLINKLLFKELNEQRMSEGLSVLANPRNAASGALRLQDAREVQKRKIEAFFYSISYAIDENGKDLLLDKYNSHVNNMKMLYDLGFRSTHKLVKRCNSIKEVLNYCHEWEEKREEYPYEIDGMVIKVDDARQQLECGATSHHPRWAIAFKFKAKQATSTLESIEYQVGRTGAITPVAKIAPVQLAGVTVASVSLFNEDVVKDKDLKLGDKVLVERAGDVIPYIVRSIAEARTGKEREIEFPRNCPACGSELVRPEGEAVSRCVNAECPAQAVEKLIHFVSKGAMDIDGLGSRQILKFYEMGLLPNIIGIYELNFDKISQLEGYGEKSISNLKNAIEASKSQPLDRLVFGLGIRHVGQRMAKTLAAAVDDIEDLKNWDQEKLMQLEDIGPKVAESIEEFFSNDQNIDLIQQLRAHGVNTKAIKKQAPASQKLDGLTFLFTGSLEKFTRDEAKEMVEDNGGKILSSVSKNLNYLVVGASPGSKLEKAQKLGTVNVLSEDEFLEMLK